MPGGWAGHSKNWVFWAEFVNSGSPVPAGWTWAAAGWASAAVQSEHAEADESDSHGTALSQRARPRHSGLPANRKRVLHRKSGGYPPIGGTLRTG